MNKKVKATSVFLKSEFWVTVVTSISGLLLAFGVITPTQANSIGSLAPQLIGALITLISTGTFVRTQHEAKVEVFRAMCAMHLENKGKAGAKAQTANTIEEEYVTNIAKMAGL